MKSFAFAFISALIFSPVTLAHYDGRQSDDLKEIRIEEDHFPGRKAKITIEIDGKLEEPPRSPSCLRNIWPCPQLHTGRYGFKCGKKKINQKDIMKAANVACPKILEKPHRTSFPMLFTAYSYGLPGPFVEWPINRKGHFWNRLWRSRKRLVMTTNCEVVGAVMRDLKGNYTPCDYVPL